MPALNYLWDPLEDNIIEEFDDAGVTLADYTTEPDHFGNVISQHRGGQSSFFHYDGQGSTLAVTDENQNVTDTRAYSAFGETTESTGSTVFPNQFRGEKGYYRDALAAQYVLRSRVFDPVWNMWLSQTTVFLTSPIRSAMRLLIKVMQQSGSQLSVSDLDTFPLGAFPGRISARLRNCAPFELEKGCCCTDAAITYIPSHADKARYAQIFMIQWARTDRIEGLQHRLSDWHHDDPPSGVVPYRWCRYSPAVYTDSDALCTSTHALLPDWPGGGQAAGQYHYLLGCPRPGWWTELNQDFETCAVGQEWLSNATVRYDVIGCIRWGHQCTFHYRIAGFPLCATPPWRWWCEVSCTITRYGRGVDQMPVPPEHVTYPS